MSRNRERRRTDEDFGEGRPVEPKEARAHGSDPDGVEACRAKRKGTAKEKKGLGKKPPK